MERSDLGENYVIGRSVRRCMCVSVRPSVCLSVCLSVCVHESEICTLTSTFLLSS